MENNKNEENSKQPYEKPRLRTIELAAEEVLGVGCKTAAGATGPAIPTCSISMCVQLGS